jgi:hypothetical protein
MEGIMKFDLRKDPEGELWDYDDDPTEDAAKRVKFLITRQTPVIRGKAADAAWIQPGQDNGHYRRQGISLKQRPGVYQQMIFKLCLKGWENVQDLDGNPIPFTPETVDAMAAEHDGAVQFVNDISEMMGRMTVERIQQERDRFRGTSEASSQLSQPRLPSM